MPTNKKNEKRRRKITVHVFDKNKVLEYTSDAIVKPMTEKDFKKILKMHLAKVGHGNYCYSVEKI